MRNRLKIRFGRWTSAYYDACRDVHEIFSGLWYSDSLTSRKVTEITPTTNLECTVNREQAVIFISRRLWPDASWPDDPKQRTPPAVVCDYEWSPVFIAIKTGDHSDARSIIILIIKVCCKMPRNLICEFNDHTITVIETRPYLYLRMVFQKVRIKSVSHLVRYSSLQVIMKFIKTSYWIQIYQLKIRWVLGMVSIPHLRQQVC